MARLNTTGNPNRIQHITKDALNGGSSITAEPDAYEMHIEFMPAGGLTIVLPGPKAVPVTAPPNTGESPNDGDFYSWKDPLGLITNTNQLTLQGGGFKFAVFGQPSFLTFGAFFQGLGAEFTFNDALGLWVGCGCGPVVINPT
jgi:hypothetical protein